MSDQIPHNYFPSGHYTPAPNSGNQSTQQAQQQFLYQASSGQAAGGPAAPSSESWQAERERFGRMPHYSASEGVVTQGSSSSHSQSLYSHAPPAASPPASHGQVGYGGGYGQQSALPAFALPPGSQGYLRRTTNYYSPYDRSVVPSPAGGGHQPAPPSFPHSSQSVHGQAAFHSPVASVIEEMAFQPTSQYQPPQYHQPPQSAGGSGAVAHYGSGAMVPQQYVPPPRRLSPQSMEHLRNKTFHYVTDAGPGRPETLAQVVTRDLNDARQARSLPGWESFDPGYSEEEVGTHLVNLTQPIRQYLSPQEWDPNKTVGELLQLAEAKSDARRFHNWREGAASSSFDDTQSSFGSSESSRSGAVRRSRAERPGPYPSSSRDQRGHEGLSSTFRDFHVGQPPHSGDFQAQSRYLEYSPPSPSDGESDQIQDSIRSAQVYRQQQGHLGTGGAGGSHGPTYVNPNEASQGESSSAAPARISTPVDFPDGRPDPNTVAPFQKDYSTGIGKHRKLTWDGDAWVKREARKGHVTATLVKAMGGNTGYAWQLVASAWPPELDPSGRGLSKRQIDYILQEAFSDTPKTPQEIAKSLGVSKVTVGREIASVKIGPVPKDAIKVGPDGKAYLTDEIGVPWVRKLYDHGGGSKVDHIAAAIGGSTDRARKMINTALGRSEDFRQKKTEEDRRKKKKT